MYLSFPWFRSKRLDFVEFREDLDIAEENEVGNDVDLLPRLAAGLDRARPAGRRASEPERG